MNEQSAEQLSRLVDGDLSESEATSLLGSLPTDEALKARWMRYCLMGNALRGSLPERLSTDLAARVQGAIAEEPTLLAPPRRSPQSHPRLVAGWAVAASVAAVASTGLWLADRGGSGSAVEANLASLSAPRQVVRLDPKDEESADPQTQAYFDQVKLNPYLFDYSENRPNVGPLPYGRIVSYERGR